METCQRCSGDGVIITCVDDICHGVGYCIHGDGEDLCPECGGEGYIYTPDQDEDDDYVDFWDFAEEFFSDAETETN